MIKKITTWKIYSPSRIYVKAKKSQKRKDKTAVLTMYRPMGRFIKLKDNLILKRMKVISMREGLEDLEKIIIMKR